MIAISASIERWPLREAFTIARGSKREAVVVVVFAQKDGATGRGEAVPYARYGESPESVIAQLDAVRDRIESRDPLRALLPAGAARNAIDLALWDLGAKLGTPVHLAAGLDPPRAIESAYTIAMRGVDETRELAARHSGRALLKVKMGAEDDLARISAVREGAPHARLIVDANEGWSIADLDRLAPRLHALAVELIEQPLPQKDDGALASWEGPIPICADESAHGEDLDALAERYDAVNLKLDKQGGLTAALDALARANELGLEIMVGTMVATSLAIAPALLLAQRARWADLDGFVFLERDREHGLRFEGSHVLPAPSLWG